VPYRGPETDTGKGRVVSSKMYSTDNYNSQQNYIYWRNNCGAKITFSDVVTSKNGRKIPLQENGLPHKCPNSPYNRARATSVGYREIRKIEEFQTINQLRDQIADTNKRLTKYQLELIVRYKER
jgi:hypothetical protein